jgi:hypothetical protein
LEIPQETFAGGLRGEATDANIRQAVAVGVRTVGTRIPSQIGSQAVWRGEAGAFADKDKAEPGSETKSDRVPDSYTALSHQTDWSDSPSRTEELREKVGKQGNGIALDRQSRKTICKDDGEVAGRRLKLSSRVGVEGPAENRLAEIRRPVRSVGLKRLHGNRSVSKDGQFSAEPPRESVKIKLRMHRIARPSVGELKVEHLTCGDTMAGSGQRYTGRRELAKSETGSSDKFGHRSDQFSERSCICVGKAI